METNLHQWQNNHSRQHCETFPDARAMWHCISESLCPVLIPCPPSDSTWRTRPLRYGEPHTRGSAKRGWEVMVVSLRRWWCLNYASDSSPGCTGGELLHGRASRIVSPGMRFRRASDDSAKMPVRYCRRCAVRHYFNVVSKDKKM